MERIGHYTIVSELGRGGMGVVFKAHEGSLNRYVAIKMLGDHLEEDSEYVERFVREAQSAAALSHPNIVQIYSISEDQGHHFFVMEYVQGTSVQRMIQTKGKLAPADVDGQRVMQETIDRGKPSHYVWLGPSELTGYTIQADVMMREEKRRMPSIGITAQRYNLILKGNVSKLSIQSWAPHLRRSSTRCR